MVETEAADEEPAPGEANASDAPKGRRSFARMRRELTDEELQNAGVQKFLLDETDRLEADCAALRGYVEKFHSADKRACVLEEKIKPQSAIDVLTGGALAVGSASIGYAPNAWANQPSGWIFLVFGAILVVVGIVAKWVAK